MFRELSDLVACEAAWEIHRVRYGVSPIAPRALAKFSSQFWASPRTAAREALRFWEAHVWIPSRDRVRAEWEILR